MNRRIIVDGPKVRKWTVKVFKSTVRTFEIVKVDGLKIVRLATHKLSHNVLPKPKLEPEKAKNKKLKPEHKIGVRNLYLTVIAIESNRFDFVFSVANWLFTAEKLSSVLF